MTAPNQSRGKVEAKRIDSFSPKRLGIKKANTVMFGAVAIASIVVAVSLVLLNFLWDLRGFNDRVIEARTEAFETLEQNLENVSALENSFFALEQDEVNSQIVLDALPSKYDFPALATSVDKQVEAAGLTLQNFAGDDLSSEAIDSAIMPEPVEMPFTLSVEGSYEDMVEFIQNFEKTIRPMVIDSIDLSGTDKVLRAQLRLHTYYQPSVDLDVETKEIR